MEVVNNNYVHVNQTENEREMWELHRLYVNETNNKLKVDLKLRNSTLYFYGNTIEEALRNRDDFCNICFMQLNINPFTQESIYPTCVQPYYNLGTSGISNKKNLYSSRAFTEKDCPSYLTGTRREKWLMMNVDAPKYAISGTQK